MSIRCVKLTTVLLLVCLSFHKIDAIGEQLPRTGQEIVVCGQLFNIGTDVVLWMDPGGYDAYRTELRFYSNFSLSSWDKYWNASWSPYERSSPARFEPIRTGEVSADQVLALRGGGWQLPNLTAIVRQFVLHYDVTAYSRRTFQVLHDYRGLSVHFMLDVDGTIYQTLDLKERAFHAGTANSRSVGVEIAHIGAYGNPNDSIFNSYYNNRNTSNITLKISNPTYLRNTSYVGRPARIGQFSGKIQSGTLYQYDFTEEQYVALAKLTASLAKIFPRIKLQAPTDAAGKLRTSTLSEAEQNTFEGLVGHFHVSSGKIDPGPAFNWNRLLADAKVLVNSSLVPPTQTSSLTTIPSPTTTPAPTTTTAATTTSPSSTAPSSSMPSCPACPTLPPTVAASCLPERTCEPCPSVGGATCGSGSSLHLAACPSARSLRELRGLMAGAAHVDLADVLVPLVLGCAQPSTKRGASQPILVFYVDSPNATAEQNAASEQAIIDAAHRGELSPFVIPETVPTATAIRTAPSTSAPETTDSQQTSTATTTTTPCPSSTAAHAQKQCEERFWLVLFIIGVLLNVVLLVALGALVYLYLKAKSSSPSYVNMKQVWDENEQEQKGTAY